MNQNKTYLSYLSYLLIIIYYFLFYASIYNCIANDGEFTISLAMQIAPKFDWLSWLIFLIPAEAILVSSIIYYFTNKLLKENPLNGKLLFPTIAAASYAIWSVLIILYSISCSGKFCGLSAFSVIFPGGFLMLFLSQIIPGMTDTVLCYFSIAINTIIYFLIAKFIISRIRKKLQSND